MYDIIVEPPAERFIKSLNKPIQKKLLDGIEELSLDPRIGKELVGRLQGFRSRRIDSYRIIYRIEEVKLIVLIINIGHRKNIYSGKLLK